MQILVPLLLILFSLEWNFSNSLTITKARDPKSNAAEDELKSYLKARHSKPKVHFQWMKPKYWKERKAKFNFCKRTRGEKLHLCRQVLGSAEYKYLIDGTRPDPTPCETRSFKIHDVSQLDRAEGKQALKMYPCITDTNPQERYFLSGTGDAKPSLYLFYEDPIPDAKNRYSIYFEAKITDIDMNKLKDARELEKKRQREIYGHGPIATVDEAAHAGPLIPSETVE